MTATILGLGSNKDDSPSILRGAIAALRGVLQNLRAASLYKTKPLHLEDQPDFFNTAVAGIFGGNPAELLGKIHLIENEYGRNRAREIRWGQRTLDIDILIFGDLVISEINNIPPETYLEIPHPRLCERRFALEPLLELEPAATHPLTGEPFQTICAKLPDQGVRKDIW